MYINSDVSNIQYRGTLMYNDFIDILKIYYNIPDKCNLTILSDKDLINPNKKELSFNLEAKVLMRNSDVVIFKNGDFTVKK